MNLLDATATLIDFAKTNAHESDRVVQRAIRRMERRYMVLKVRAARNRKRARTKAFWFAMAAFNGGGFVDPSIGHRRAAFPCRACENNFFFGDFCKHGQWDGRGIATQVVCPSCSAVMTPPPHVNGVLTATNP